MGQLEKWHIINFYSYQTFYRLPAILEMQQHCQAGFLLLYSAHVKSKLNLFIYCVLTVMIAFCLSQPDKADFGKGTTVPGSNCSDHTCSFGSSGRSH